MYKDTDDNLVFPLGNGAIAVAPHIQQGWASVGWAWQMYSGNIVGPEWLLPGGKRYFCDFRYRLMILRPVITTFKLPVKVRILYLIIHSRLILKKSRVVVPFPQ